MNFVLALEVNMEINKEIQLVNTIFKQYGVDIRIPMVFGALDAHRVLEMYKSGMGAGFYDLHISKVNGHLIDAEQEAAINQTVHNSLETLRIGLESYTKFVPISKCKKKGKS